jgi:hypothetical protein
MTALPRVAVLTTEPPPLPGLAATGAGLRAWALAQGLRSAGHEQVTIAVTADAFAAQGGKVPDAPRGGPMVVAVPRAEIASHLNSGKYDAVVAQHWGVLESVEKITVPLAIDLAGPHLLERRFWGSPSPENDRRSKLRALAQADHATCSGRSQRHYFLPFLLEAGFASAADLCPVIPFSVSPDLPSPAADRDHSAFMFGGFFLPWQDPEKPLRWLLEEMTARGRGRLEFFGGVHPTLDVSRGRYESLLDTLEASPQVRRRGVVPFDEMVLAMRSCGIALDLFPPNLERELAFPSRTIVYLWAGLPVIHAPYDDVAPLIEKYRAGWLVDPENEGEVRRLCGRLIGHSEDVVRRAEGARKLVRECLTWDQTIAPMAKWTADPRKREGKVRIAVGAAAKSAVAVEAAPGGAPAESGGSGAGGRRVAVASRERCAAHAAGDTDIAARAGAFAGVRAVCFRAGEHRRRGAVFPVPDCGFAGGDAG